MEVFWMNPTIGDLNIISLVPFVGMRHSDFRLKSQSRLVSTSRWSPIPPQDSVALALQI